MAMECRKCGCRVCRVTNTYTHDFTFRGKKVTRVRRRRVCRNCATVFHTFESHTDVIQELTKPDEPTPDNGKGENPYL